jgi:citrate lyase subunit beta/citryl-CoA lyase
MRSVFYVPSNNEKMVGKAPTIVCDVLTLDLEDSVPPAEKPKGREMIQQYLKADREKQVAPCLAKCGDAENVKRLDWKLEELEQRRGMEVGSVAIQLLIETAKGVMNAYPAAGASPRVNSLIFGAVDFTKDMRVTLTSEGQEQLYARFHTAVAARAAGCVAIDCPFVAFQDMEGYKKSTREGRQMGYEGRMLIHPSQIEPSHEIYTPSAEDVEWAEGVKKVFEEEGIAKGTAAVTYKGKMVDTPVYENAMQILRTMEEIRAAESKA